jgi:hypothetical protein
MTIRTFWAIFIKMLGIWLVLGSLTVIPMFFSTLFFAYSNGRAHDFMVTLFLLLLIIGIYLFVLQLFIFKASWLIGKLHLDKGFDEERIDLDIQLASVLTVATIVIGGIIFVDSLPELCKHIFDFYQQKSVFRESPTSGWIFFYLVKMVLGYLLMTNSKHVVAFIERQTAKQKDNID